MNRDELSIRELRRQLPAAVDRAEHGETTIVTRHGKPVARLAPLEPPVITLYETNSDLLIMARGTDAWSMGAPGASPGYLEGTFAEDAEAWATGDWEPNEGDGQHPTDLGDDITPVATWDKDQGVVLRVDRHNLGGAGVTYLYGR